MKKKKQRQPVLPSLVLKSLLATLPAPKLPKVRSKPVKTAFHQGKVDFDYTKEDDV